MDEAMFWKALEYRVCREMDGVEACKRAGMWCDGFIPETVELDTQPPRISGRAWIGFGTRHQEAWTFELSLPRTVLRVEAIAWAELLPAEDMTHWLTLDPERQHVVVAPGEAVHDTD
jgi:hypothetical protein